MGRAFQPLTPGSAIEDFTGTNRLEPAPGGPAYEMTGRDGHFFMRQIVYASDGTEVAAYEREMMWVLGSGNHSRSYLTGEEGYLYQMPVCWYPGKPGWDLCPGYEHNNLFFMREAAGECLFCHNGRVPLREGTTNRYGEGMPHGIGCERCHGPGAAHVALWSDPPEEMPGRDTTIVNPARLDRKLRLQACLQCHLGDSGATERVWREGRDPREFHPGLDLDDFMDPLAFTSPTANLYGLTAQADRMIRSRCWSESGGAMECLTCHNPHESVYTIPDRAAHFRAACLTCHEQADCGVDSGHDGAGMESRAAGPPATASGKEGARGGHRTARAQSTPHGAGIVSRAAGPPATASGEEGARGGHGTARAQSSPYRAGVESGPGAADMTGGGDCVACHMRRSEPSDHRFALFTDHWIRRRVDPPAPPLHQRDSLELAPVFPGSHAAIPEAEALADLGHAYRKMKIVNPLGHLIPWSRVDAPLRDSLRLDPSRGATWYELGKAASARGEMTEAVADLREAIRLAPGHFDAHEELGTILVDLGRSGEAITVLEAALAIKPDEVRAMTSLGRALVLAGREEEGERIFLRAAGTVPAHSTPPANLGLLALRRGRPVEAVEHLLDAVAREPSKPEIWEALSGALSASGREAEAASASRTAARIRERR
jgi:Flp pilus assembly protein TadD